MNSCEVCGESFKSVRAHIRSLARVAGDADHIRWVDANAPRAIDESSPGYGLAQSIKPILEVTTANNPICPACHAGANVEGRPFATTQDVALTIADHISGHIGTPNQVKHFRRISG
jgi:hypothetical protein